MYFDANVMCTQATALVYASHVLSCVLAAAAQCKTRVCNNCALSPAISSTSVAISSNFVELVTTSVRSEASGENRVDYVFMSFRLWRQEHVKRKTSLNYHRLAHGYLNTATPYEDFAKFIKAIITSVK